MGRRTDLFDVAAMALIFQHDANSSVNMIAYETVERFDAVINKNLDDMDSEVKPPIHSNDSSVYFYATRTRDRKVYYAIVPGADIEEARLYHLGPLPVDIIVAAEKANALATIGLKLDNGGFIAR